MADEYTPGDIIYQEDPRSNSAQVVDDEGNLHGVQLVYNLAPGDIIYQENNPKSNSAQVVDDEGNLHGVQLVYLMGGNGTDSHNKGWFEDEEALETAYPIGEDGDYAFLGSTDTIWVWDSDNSEWVDTDRKGQVTSVNNQTGDVTVQETLVNQSNIKSINGNSILGSGNLEIAAHLNYPASWPVNSSTTTKAFCDAVAADTTAVEGKMYLGEVRWSDLPGLANGEVVVEIMTGTTAQNKVIVLTLTSGNQAPYMWKYTYWNGGSNVSGWIGFQPELPSQSGQSGKFLTTDGSSMSWGSVDALPSQTGNAGKVLGTDGTTAAWETKTTVTFRTWGANE